MPYTRPGPGRPKGSKNKFTTLKEMFIEVVHRLGDADALEKFANDSKNKKEFWKMIASMLPKTDKHEHEVTGKDGGPIEFAAVKSKLLSKINSIATRAGKSKDTK